MAGMYADNKAAQVGVTTTLSIIVVTDLIGNTLVILIILTNKSMKSPMNYLLVNLAVADMMVGLFFAPQFISGQLFTHPDGLTGTILCKILTGGGLAWIGGAASVLSLIAISFERYVAIMHPYSTKLKLTKKKIKRLVVVCWIVAVIALIPCLSVLNYDKEAKLCAQDWPKQHPWYGKAYSTFCLFFFGIIPITIMFALYSRVVYTLWFKRSEHRAQGTQLAMLKSRKRVTKMMVIVSVIYSVCWFPDSIIYLLYHYGITHNYAIDIPSIIGMVLVTCNSAINPFIYTFQSEKFRRHLMELVCCRKLRILRISVGSKGDSFNTAQEIRSQTTDTKTPEEHSM